MREATDDEPLAVRIAVTTVLAMGLGYLVTYLWCAALRVGFGWDLEWMEGGMITHAARVVSGKPIYAPPSLDFVSFFYTPLYPYLLAALSYVSGGLSFALARGVSIASSLAIMAMLFYAARREAGLRAGLLAVGLYASMFRISGAFYDLARADSFSLALALGASLVAFYVPRSRGALLAALLFVAAFFAKQTAALPAPFVGLYLLATDRKRALIFGLTGIVMGAGSFFLLDHHYDGWLRFYTLTGHQGHLFYWRNFYLEFFRDVLFLSPFLLLLPAYGASYGRYTRWLVLPFLGLIVWAFVQRVQTLDYDEHMYFQELWYERRRSLLLIPPLVMAAMLGAARFLQRDLPAPPVKLLLIYLAGVLASDLNHSTQWAYANCFMPIAVFGSLYAAVSFAPLTAVLLPPRLTRHIATIMLAVAMCVQFVALWYNPRRQVPSLRDYQMLKIVKKQLDAQPGPVFMPAHPLYSYQRDGTIHLHQMGIGDVQFAGGLNDFAGRIAAGEFPTIVLEQDSWWDEMNGHYEEVHRFRYKRGVLFPKTGFRVRPGAVYRSNKARDAADHTP